MGNTSLQYTFYLYARSCDEKRVEIEDLRDACFAAIVANKGAQIVSTTGNGISVAFSSGSSSMSNQDLFEVCVQALEMLDGRKTSKIRGYLR